MSHFSITALPFFLMHDPSHWKTSSSWLLFLNHFRSIMGQLVNFNPYSWTIMVSYFSVETLIPCPLSFLRKRNAPRNPFQNRPNSNMWCILFAALIPLIRSTFFSWDVAISTRSTLSTCITWKTLFSSSRKLFESSVVIEPVKFEGFILKISWIL